MAKKSRLSQLVTGNSPLGRKITVRSIQEMTDQGQPIVALTAYDYPMAKILDQCGVDIILVGDSVGNVLLGDENTLPVTIDDMVRHTRAVSKAVRRALVVADMPFLSYQVDHQEAVRNAGRLIKESGAEAVKVEGAEYMDAVRAMVKAGIPVMGHVGLTPQRVHEFGGYQKRGKDAREAKEIRAAAKKLEGAGCFSIVLEMVPQDLAHQITRSLKIPTIGIGAGPYCDGQILVLYDLLGLSPHIPSFVRSYEQLGKKILSAVSHYVTDIRTRKFPG